MKHGQLTSGAVPLVEGQVVAVLVGGQQVGVVVAEVEVPWEVTLSGDRLDVLDGEVRLNCEDGDRVLAPVGGVDELAVTGEADGSSTVVGGPVGRDGLDRLDVGEAGIGGVVLQDLELAAEFTQHVGVLAIRVEGNVTGSEAVLALVAGNGSQLAVSGNVVNHQQVHPQVADDQALVRRQVGVVNVRCFLFRPRTGGTLVGYGIRLGQGPVGVDLEDVNLGRVVVGTVEQLAVTVQANVCRWGTRCQDLGEHLGVVVLQ